MRSHAESCRAHQRWGRREALALALVGTSLAFVPAQARAADLAVEAETMAYGVIDPADGTTWPRRISDSSASGGQAIKFGPNGAATKDLFADASSRITLRARADQCDGAARATIKLDGTIVASPLVGSTSWTDYTQSVTVAPGAHRLEVAFDNNFYRSGCNRNLYVDKLTFIARDVTPPGAPTGLVATPGDGRVALDWADNTEADVGGYDVLRSTTSGSGYVKLTSSPLNASAYHDDSSTNGITYHYVVKAVDQSGNVGSTSSEVSATPAAPTVVPGTVNWTAGAELSMEKEFAAWSAASLSRYSRVSSPRGQGSYAYRFELRDGDYSYGERVELGMGNGNLFSGRSRNENLFNEGEERWISMQTQVPDNFPINTTSWNVVHQIKCLGDGGPSISMEVGGGKWKLKTVSQNQRSNTSQVSRWSAPAARNRWVRFTYHVLFSPKSNVGYVELYGDLQDGQGMRTLLPRLTTHTMKYENGTSTTIPNFSRIGMYRDPNISGDAVIYHDGYTVATTRAAAEAQAFGP